MPLVGRAQSVEATGHEHENLRFDVADALPGRLDGRLPGIAQQVPTARSTDLLGDPVAGREGWVEPFERNDPSRRHAGEATLKYPVFNTCQALAQQFDQSDRFILGLG